MKIDMIINIHSPSKSFHIRQTSFHILWQDATKRSAVANLYHYFKFAKILYHFFEIP